MNLKSYILDENEFVGNDLYMFDFYLLKFLYCRHQLVRCWLVQSGFFFCVFFFFLGGVPAKAGFVWLNFYWLVCCWLEEINFWFPGGTPMLDRINWDWNIIDTASTMLLSTECQYECQLVRINFIFCPGQSCSLFDLIFIGKYIVG